MVGFDYLTDRPARSGLGRLNMAVVGVQGALQPGLEVPPAQLADMLNAARERWLTETVEPSQVASMAPSPIRPSLLAALAGSRLDRKTYWIAVGVAFAISAVLTFLPGSRFGATGVSTVLFVRVFAGRLHDLGRSGWWQAVPYALMLGVAVPLTLKVSEEVGLDAALLIQILFILMLGAIPGEPRVNRFGPPPGRPSPLALSEAFR